jgi:capsular polysaccharide transport system permease protein
MSPFREKAAVPVAKTDATAPRTWVARVGRALLPPGNRHADRIRDQLRDARGQVGNWLGRHRPYTYLVILPTLIAAAYYALIAAPQYLSEAHFIVLGAPTQSKGEGSLSQMMSGGGGDTNTLAVIDFMQSREAVEALDREVNLKEIYHKPKLDFLARLGAEPTMERLYRYLFKRDAMVHLRYDFMNFVGTIKVYAFDPVDAHRVADQLLQLGDQLVDRLNKRSVDDALRVARTELQRAEERVVAVGEKLTRFRTQHQELDFTKSAGAALDVIGRLESNLAQAQADLTAASVYMKPDSSKYRELQSQAKALEEQITAQKTRLTGEGGVAPEIASYERLQLERGFADQDYQIAARALEQAQLQAQKQQLFLVRTVDARIPQEAEYPRSFIIVLTLFITLTVAYGIGWLILAGVREHAG